jgi:hypothetical protein
MNFHIINKREIIMHPEIDKKIFLFFLNELEKNNLRLETSTKISHIFLREEYTVKERTKFDMPINKGYYLKHFNDSFKTFSEKVILKFENPKYKENFLNDVFIQYYLQNPQEQKILMKFYSMITTVSLIKSYENIFSKICTNFVDFKKIFLSLSLKDFSIYHEKDFERLDAFMEKNYSIKNQEKTLFWRDYIQSKKQLKVASNILFMTSFKNFLQKNYPNDIYQIVKNTLLEDFIQKIDDKDSTQIFQEYKDSPIYIKIDIEKTFKIFLIDNFAHTLYYDKIKKVTENVFQYFKIRNKLDYQFLEEQNYKKLGIIIEKYPKNFSEKLLKEMIVDFLKSIKNKEITGNDSKEISTWVNYYLLNKEMKEEKEASPLKTKIKI